MSAYEGDKGEGNKNLMVKTAALDNKSNVVFHFFIRFDNRLGVFVKMEKTNIKALLSLLKDLPILYLFFKALVFGSRDVTNSASAG